MHRQSRTVQNRETVLTVPSELMDNPTVQGQPKPTRGHQAGSGGGGTGSEGRDQGNQNSSRVRASKNRGGRGGRRGRHRAPISPASAAPSGARPPFGTSLLGSWASPRRLTLQVPSEDREGPDKCPGATKLPSSLSRRPASVPQPPLTGMQAATTWAAVATRLFPARTSTPAGPHQLSFQHKQKSSGRGATPTAPSRPCGSDARAGRVYPPVREEPLRRARASASLSVAGPLSEACAREQEWAQGGRRACVHAPACAGGGGAGWWAWGLSLCSVCLSAGVSFHLQVPEGPFRALSNPRSWGLRYQLPGGC